MNFFQAVSANPNATSETIEKRRLSWNSGLKGCMSHSLETRQKMKQSRKEQIGTPATEEKRQKISQANKGKTPWNKGISGPLMTPNGLILGGVQEVADLSGKSRIQVYRWIKRWPQHYYYIKDAE